MESSVFSACSPGLVYLGPKSKREAKAMVRDGGVLQSVGTRIGAE